MSEKPSPFAAIFAVDDPHGLLAGKRAGPPCSSEDEIAIANFEAINAFIDQQGVLPGSTEDGRQPSLNEYTLEAHLDAFRDGVAYRNLLALYDRHGLLGTPAAAAAPATMAELIASGDPLLHDSAEQIFTLRHVEPPPKTTPDEIAKRQPCENFADFAPIFATLKADLATGRRRANARTRVIFGNGTESNLLLRSFARALYDDNTPRQIIETAPAPSGPLFTGEPDAGNPDERLTGSIYVVESLSPEPNIAALRGRLYKIGFTTQAVESRLANVDTDPTFLFAPVKIVAIFDTVDLNPRVLEKLLHQFFAHACLKVDILLGRTVSPREWFVVPVELVREAINRILDDTIVNYRYDHISRKIVSR
jgi:hypothetical protein